MADDTAALLDALEVESADVFGVSLGGMVAQEFVLRHPNRVRKLVLACTHAGPRSATRAPEWAIEIFNESVNKPRADALRSSAPILFSKKTVAENSQLVEDTLAVMENNNQSKSSYLLQLGAVMKHDTIDRLHQITHPTLVMTGSEDTLVDPGNSRLIAEHIPGAKLIEFPQTGHVFFTEKAEDVNRVLIDFFKGES